jgi:hypothetical protein
MGTGSIFNDAVAAFPVIQKYGVGDTVGCFWNCHSDNIFFTINGKNLKSNFLGARSQTQGKKFLKKLKTNSWSTISNSYLPLF